MFRKSLFLRLVAAATAVPLIASLFVVFGASAANASSGPFTPSVVTTNATTHVICRAYGGALSANKEADQDLTYKITAPDAVQPGQTYDIKIRPMASGFPATDTSVTTANITAVYNQIARWKLPDGLTINSATLAPANGDTTTNPDAGFYVVPADVPKVNIPNKGSYPDPNFDPMTLPAAKRIAIPGTAPAVLVDPATNIVRLGMLGTGNESDGTVFPGGSMVQAPTITINVTAESTVAAGTDLGIKLAGSLPAGSFTGSQPTNFPAPTGITVNRTTVTSSDTTWSDPGFVIYTYVSALGGLIKTLAKTACGPGWEATSDFPTAPSYYTGPNAIPNGTAPLMNHTTVVGVGSTAPFEGASYITGTSVPVAYSCIANPAGETYDTCEGDLDNGDLLDTSTPGTYEFTIEATDAYQAPITRTIHYTVADPLAPVASAGAAQTGKLAGSTVTLAGSATDPNGPPALGLTYSWTQTSGPAVTLSNANAAQPTFTVPAVDNPAGNTLGFDLTVSNGYLTNTASTTVTSAASTPTVTVSQARQGGGGTFYTGDLMTLSAAITNPDGNAAAGYTYAWTKTTGLAATLSDPTAANPTYTMPVNGTAACTNGTTATNCPRFSVVVTKTNTGKASAATALGSSASSLPTRPVANAGANQNVPSAGGAVTLNGSASAQAQGHTLSYAWTQTGGPTVTLSDAAAVSPTFTAPAGGSTPTALTFSLVVTDTQNPLTSGTNIKTSLAVTTTVTIVPDHVVAAASATPVSPVAGNTVTLDGSASTDPTLASLDYTWTQTAGPAVLLSDAHAQKPTFVAPPATSPSGTTLEFSLTASNGGSDPEDSGSTTLTVTVVASTPTATVSQARQGGGATFFSGDLMTLSAAITNPDGNAAADYTYLWTKTTGLAVTLSDPTAANPTYIMPANAAAACSNGTGATNCPRFSVVVTKINTGKASAAATLASSASSLPGRPVAVPGANQTKLVGTEVLLDGSGTQAQNHPLSYAWTQTAGPSVTLSSATAQKPTFTPTSAGTYTFSLVVTDTQNPITSGTGIRTSLAVSTTVTVTNGAPVASIAAPADHVGGDEVTLDGSASSDPDGQAITYAWTQTDGPAVTLSDAASATPTFTAPVGPATLTFQLAVSDGFGGTDTESVTVNILNRPPVASIAPIGTVAVDDEVTLDGSASSDPDGHALSYSWTQTGGPEVTLSDATSATPTFIAPVGPGSVSFQLTVSDGHGGTDSKSVTVNIDNSAPVADAGPDQSGFVPGDVVTLDGTGSSDDDGDELTYTWVQTGGPTALLSDTNSATPTFVTPTGGPATLTFQLTVDDGNGGTSTDSVSIGILRGNHNPVANAGPDQSGFVLDDTVVLNGTGSTDPDGDPLSYSWAQTGGPTVGLSDPTSATPNFLAPTGPVTLTFQLTVDDGLGGSSTDSVSIVVSGTPGLDLSSTLTGTIAGEKNLSKLKVSVGNASTATQMVANLDVEVAVSINGTPVDPSNVVVASKVAQIKPGKATVFNVTWSGYSLVAGDVVEIEACVNRLGDQDPENNCSTLTHGGVIDLSTTSVVTAITNKSTSNTVKVTALNEASSTYSPIRASDLSVSVKVNGLEVGTVTPPASDKAAALKAGKSKNYSFKWAHPKLVTGDVVEITSCVNVPGNTSASSCSVITRVV